MDPFTRRLPLRPDTDRKLAGAVAVATLAAVLTTALFEWRAQQRVAALLRQQTAELEAQREVGRRLTRSIEQLSQREQRCECRIEAPVPSAAMTAPKLPEERPASSE